MKIDKYFAVKINGHIYTVDKIANLIIDGESFKMTYVSMDTVKLYITANIKDVEFISLEGLYIDETGQMPQTERIESKLRIEEVETKNIFGEKTTSTEITADLETIRELFAKTIKVDSEAFMKLVKDYKRTGGE